MTLVEIEALLMSLLPTITSITAIIVVATKMLSSFKALIEAIKGQTENKELMAQLKTVHAENQKLKKVMTQFIEAQSRVHYDDMTGNENDKEI